jgi:hypothetical protein
MTTPTERGIAAALTGTVDVGDEVTARAIAAELYDFGQRAWALRARVADLRDVEATFYVSNAMLELLRCYGLDLGAGPGGMFRIGDDGQTETLFGIVIACDPEPAVMPERHRGVTLELVDLGPDAR